MAKYGDLDLGEPILHIVEKERFGPVFSISVAMLVVGVGAMFASMINTSPTWLVGYAALWTGWNVLWGMAALMSRHKFYTIHRLEGHREIRV